MSSLIDSWINDLRINIMNHAIIKNPSIMGFTGSQSPWVVPIYVMINWQPWNWQHDSANFDHFSVTSCKKEACEDMSFLDD